MYLRRWGRKANWLDSDHRTSQSKGFARMQASCPQNKLPFWISRTFFDESLIQICKQTWYKEGWIILCLGGSLSRESASPRALSGLWSIFFGGSTCAELDTIDLPMGFLLDFWRKKKKICLSAASKRSLIILHSAVTDVTVMVYLRSNTANAWHTLYPKYLNIAGRMCFPASICWIVEFRDFYEAEGTLQKLSGEQQSDCFTRIIPCVQIMYVLLSFVCMTNYREVPYWEMQ